MPRLLVVALFCTALTHASAAAWPALVWPDREHIDPAQDDVAKKSAGVGRAIEIGAQTKIDAHFFITTKGNGVVTLPGLTVRIYDAHGDEITFQGRLLRCEWRDEDGDGYLDLVVGGWADHFSEKGDRVVKSVPLRAVFRYLPKQRRFETVVCPPEIYTWIPKP